MASNEDTRAEAQRAYLDERKLLIDAHREVAQSFDKILTTLSAAALGLSIAFIQDIAPEPTHHAVLAWAWALLAISLLAILAGHLFSQFGLQRAVSNLDANETARQNASTEAGRTANWWRVSTTLMNVTALATFIAGAGCLAAFSFLNLP